MNTYELNGTWQVRLNDRFTCPAQLPGTLDENAIGHADLHAAKWHPDVEIPSLEDLPQDQHLITSRFTRQHIYSGAASFSRTFSWQALTGSALPSGTRVFLDIERTRHLTAHLNQALLQDYDPQSLSTPSCFELTSLLQEENALVLDCDNTYPGWPHDAIVYSSAATDETQTNWNGILGVFRLRLEKSVVVSSLLVYPHIRTEDAAGSTTAGMASTNTGCLDIRLCLDSACTADTREMIRISSDALQETLQQEVILHPGRNLLRFDRLPLQKDARHWDEYEGNLYSLCVTGSGFLSKTVSFGIRDFCNPRSPYLTLNGRRLFLRSETNCSTFPETGHVPMELSAWLQIFNTYKDYGINCVRFHSSCPPEAAFEAADRLGMLVQPELSNWDPKTAFESAESFLYYQQELNCILTHYGNHPSFVMLTLGNELHCNETGILRMQELLRQAKEFDSTRLYACASNPFYGHRGCDPDSDFYTSSSYKGQMIRGTGSNMAGHINQQPPCSTTGYTKELAVLRKASQKPVFTFEVGQYEILPDFHEMELFHGVTRPDNFEFVRKRAAERGLLKNWDQKLEATGELALLCYREEVEAVLRTPELSGISLLGLQDFPGQGTALIGMLNSHLQTKPFPFADPSRFRSFLRPVVPLLYLDRFTFTDAESLHARIFLANYGKTDLHAKVSWSIASRQGLCPVRDFPQGTLTHAGDLDLDLSGFTAPGAYQFQLRIGDCTRTYPLWIYPAQLPSMQESAPDVLVTGCLSEALCALQQGQKVFLSPPADKDHFLHAIRTCFSTDFWSVGTFPTQEGYMGFLTDPAHPVFSGFPTAGHPDWNWWQLTHNAVAMQISPATAPLIEVIDCYARLRKMAFLAEFRVGNGRLLLSSLGLLQKDAFPEARSLLTSILSYMHTDAFQPTQVLSPEELDRMVK